MINNPFQTDKTDKLNILLDASKIDLFETCPARYDYRYNHNKVLSATHKATALDLGGLAHEGFASYFTLLGEGKHYNERMTAALQKINTIAADPDQSSLEPEEVSWLCKCFEESCDYWRAEDENSVEVLAVEQPFAYVLYEDELVRIIISGKIDLLTNFHGIGKASSYSNLPFDHKTFSRETELLRKANQFINYCNAVGSNYLIVNRVGLQKSLKAQDKYKRLPLSYDPDYIQDWKANLTKMIMNEYMTCLTENFWPEKSTSCNKFNRLCEYYNGVCDSSGDREYKLLKLYRDYADGEVWDVTKSLKEE